MSDDDVTLTAAEKSVLSWVLAETPRGHLGPWVAAVERILADRLEEWKP